MGICRTELSKPELGCGCRGSRMEDRGSFPWAGVPHMVPQGSVRTCPPWQGTGELWAWTQVMTLREGLVWMCGCLRPSPQIPACSGQPWATATV